MRAREGGGIDSEKVVGVPGSWTFRQPLILWDEEVMDLEEITAEELDPV